MKKIATCFSLTIIFVFLIIKATDSSYTKVESICEATDYILIVGDVEYNNLFFLKDSYYSSKNVPKSIEYIVNQNGILTMYDTNKIPVDSFTIDSCSNSLRTTDNDNSFFESSFEVTNDSIKVTSEGNLSNQTEEISKYFTRFDIIDIN